MPRNTELGPHIKKIVLNLEKASARSFRQDGRSEHHANSTVRFVDASVSLYAQRLFLYPRTISETRRAIVAGARVNFAKSVSHNR
jgi:hypothetical protein